MLASQSVSKGSLDLLEISRVLAILGYSRDMKYQDLLAEANLVIAAAHVVQGQCRISTHAVICSQTKSRPCLPCSSCWRPRWMRRRQIS